MDSFLVFFVVLFSFYTEATWLFVTTLMIIILSLIGNLTSGLLMLIPTHDKKQLPLAFTPKSL